MKRRVKVSVFCLTYNHAAYIENAIKGFLMQKTTFSYNVFIFDDASNDGTSEILVKYQKMYPDIINIYISPVNTYNSAERPQILLTLYERYLTGEYIALCEGDDYWIDDHKLSKQIEFMDQNRNCSMTAHAFQIFNILENTIYIKRHKSRNTYLSAEEVILQPNGNLATASLVMRREVFWKKYKLPSCDIEDFIFQLSALDVGKIYYFSDVMSVYRYMHDGSWCKITTLNPKKIIQHNIGFVDFLIKYNEYVNNVFEAAVWKKIIIYLYQSIEVAHAIKLRNIQEIMIIEKKIAEAINYVLGWMSGEPMLTEKQEELLMKFRNVYIMGKGKYSEYITNSLKRMKIEISGYIVSNHEGNTWDDQTYMINEIENYENVLVIIGISQMKEREITEILKIHHIYNCFFPLWFDHDEVMKENNFCLKENKE